VNHSRISGWNDAGRSMVYGNRLAGKVKPLAAGSALAIPSVPVGISFGIPCRLPFASMPGTMSSRALFERLAPAAEHDEDACLKAYGRTRLPNGTLYAGGLFIVILRQTSVSTTWRYVFHIAINM